MNSALSALEGNWELIKAEMGGERAPEVLSRRTTLRLAENQYWVYFDGLVTDHGLTEEGAAGRAKTLLLRGTDGPNVGRILYCIYQHVGDRLRICYGLDGVMPDRFATREGEARSLATYRRMSAASSAAENSFDDTVD